MQPRLPRLSYSVTSSLVLMSTPCAGADRVGGAAVAVGLVA